MRTFKPTYTTPDGAVKESPRYWLDFSWKRQRCKLPGFTSLSQSLTMGRRLVDLMGALSSGETPDASLVRWAQALAPSMQARLVRVGLLDGRFAAAGKPLVEHLADWQAVLLAKGNTEAHAQRYFDDAGRIIALAKANFAHELTPSRVQRAIATLREGTKEIPGLSLQSCNHMLRAVKSFTRWLVSDRRATDDALAHLKGFNVATDKRHERRALADDEIRRLIDAAERGGTVFGMAGIDRAMLYRLALGTGFRSNELRSLTPESFTLDANPPTVTIEAGYSKHRRRDVQPIRLDMADALAPWLDGKAAGVAVFSTMPAKWSIARMLHRDLAAAGIVQHDDGGKTVDFHALRHTFITRLVQSGASVKVAQELARHSTPVLTLGRYSHIGLHDTSKALDALPSLAPNKPDTQAMRKTGTDDLPMQNTAHTPRTPQTANAGLSLANGAGLDDAAGRQRTRATDDTPDHPAADETHVDTSFHLDTPLSFCGVGGRFPAVSGGAKNAKAGIAQTPINIGECRDFAGENTKADGGSRTRNLRFTKPLLCH